MLEVLTKLSQDVNEKIDTDSKVREMAQAKDRTIVLHFTDEKTYILSLKEGKMEVPLEGDMEDPTLRVTTDTKTMNKILEKKMNPLMAYAMKKIKVKGPMDDIMVLKDIF